MGETAKGEKAAADEAYKQALKIAPDSPDVKRWHDEFLDDSHDAVLA